MIRPPSTPTASDSYLMTIHHLNNQAPVAPRRLSTVLPWPHLDSAAFPWLAMHLRASYWCNTILDASFLRLPEAEGPHTERSAVPQLAARDFDKDYAAGTETCIPTFENFSHLDMFVLCTPRNCNRSIEALACDTYTACDYKDRR
jgi:hypothetical protein